MKKFISILLVLTMIFAVSACGKKKVENTEDNNDNQVVENLQEDEVKEETEEPEEKEEEKKEDKKEEVKPTEKPTQNQIHLPNKPQENKPQEAKPDVKPQENKPVESKPVENKPVENKPVENKPVESKPAESKPQETKPTTIGTTLLAEFNKKASSMGSEALAKELLKNPVILFRGDTLPVEEGYLTGFGNTEIKGFKSGTMFGPIIGSIAFIGYIFELESGADANAFISNLRSNAKMNWNICVEAEEMITGNVGNKVFFVMCPKNIEE